MMRARAEGAEMSQENELILDFIDSMSRARAQGVVLGAEIDKIMAFFVNMLNTQSEGQVMSVSEIETITGFYEKLLRARGQGRDLSPEMEDTISFLGAIINAHTGQETTIGFLEATARARAGGQVMGTQIEGQGGLARIQEIMERRQAGSQIERLFLSKFYQISQVYQGIDADSEVVLKDKFLKLRHASCKNPTAFLLAHIALNKSGNITKKGLHLASKLAVEIDETIFEEDIIRYCRLISPDSSTSVVKVRSKNDSPRGGRVDQYDIQTPDQPPSPSQPQTPQLTPNQKMQRIVANVERLISIMEKYISKGMYFHIESRESEGYEVDEEYFADSEEDERKKIPLRDTKKWKDAIRASLDQGYNAIYITLAGDMYRKDFIKTVDYWLNQGFEVLSDGNEVTSKEMIGEDDEYFEATYEDIYVNKKDYLFVKYNVVIFDAVKFGKKSVINREMSTPAQRTEHIRKLLQIMRKYVSERLFIHIESFPSEGFEEDSKHFPDNEAYEIESIDVSNVKKWSRALANIPPENTAVYITLGGDLSEAKIKETVNYWKREEFEVFRTDDDDISEMFREDIFYDGTHLTKFIVYIYNSDYFSQFRARTGPDF